MKNAKKYGGTLLMKNKILALVLAGTMLFGQNVYATELVTPENNDVMPVMTMIQVYLMRNYINQI